MGKDTAAGEVTLRRTLRREVMYVRGKRGNLLTVLMAGCGDLGTEIGMRFADAGHHVVALRRTPEHLPSRIQGRAVDLSTPLPSLPTDTDIIVVVLTADQYTPEAYRTTYVDGLTNVLDALHRDGIRAARVVFVSSTAVYGITDGSWIDERTPASPHSETGSVLADAECLLHSRIPDATVVRLAGLYGPGRTSLINRVRHGEAPVTEAPRYTNRIHRDDAAAAVVHLSTVVENPAPTYIGVDDEPTDRSELVRFLADELNVAPPVRSTETTSPGLGKRCSNNLLRSTGFEFVYPTYRDGYRAILHGHGTRHP